MEVLYQPIVSIQTGEILAVEALVRWNHPERGILLPEDFLHIAEETGYVNAIGDWSLNTACQQLAAWRNKGLANIWITVNLSDAQMLNPDLIDTIKKALEKSALPGEALCLDIHERSTMVDFEYSLQLLDQIHQIY